jgi:uncharacterized membrane protein YphA (DoxX/SURF4 family)
MPEVFYKSGKYFFAFSVLAFGFIQLNVQDFMSGFLPVSAGLPGRSFFLYLSSALFIAGGIAMCIQKITKRAAFFVGVLFLILFFYPHLFNLLWDLHNPNLWTSAAEDLAICGGAFMIAGDMVIASSENIRRIRQSELFLAGKILFGFSLTVFAVQHFMYADFIATLITAWIPFKLFWAYFVGLAFALAAISILFNKKTRLASILLGFMFLFWFLSLHLPRVTANPHKETEKTSLFIALAFSGIFFTLASLYDPKPRVKKD